MWARILARFWRRIHSEKASSDRSTSFQSKDMEPRCICGAPTRIAVIWHQDQGTTALITPQPRRLFTGADFQTASGKGPGLVSDSLCLSSKINALIVCGDMSIEIIFLSSFHINNNQYFYSCAFNDRFLQRTWSEMGSSPSASLHIASRFSMVYIPRT